MSSNHVAPSLGDAITGILVTACSKITDGIYVGDSRSASRPELLHKYKITHVLNCTEEVPNYFDPSSSSSSSSSIELSIESSIESSSIEMETSSKNVSIEQKEIPKVIYQRVALPDWPELTDFLAQDNQSCQGMLLKGVEWIENIQSQDPSSVILIHCFHGINRSVAVVLVWLMAVRKMSLASALTLVQSVRPQALPNRLYMGFIQRVELTTFGSTSLGYDHFKDSVDRQCLGLATK